MKGNLVIIIFFLFVGNNLFGQDNIGLEEAINKFAEELVSRIPDNIKVAVVAFDTVRKDLKDVFIETMMERINDRKIVLIERENIKYAQKEIGFSMTGLISELTAQRIGHFIGANIVIYGVLRKGEKKNEYKINITATVTETAVILLTKNYKIRIGHNPYLWSVGASVGTAFTKPFMIGTIRGTIAPLQHSFLELGVDIGIVSGKPDVDYYSVYPYANCAYFLSFDKGGWYIGTGIGYFWSLESSANSNYRYRIIAMNFVTGFNIANVFDISYTLRTNFKNAGSKFSVGYTYRFK